MQDKCAARLPIKSFTNTIVILIQQGTQIHIRFTKLVAIDVKIWIKKLSLKGFCPLVPFCKTVTQMNGLNMMWIEIKTTAVGDIANFLLYHRAVGTICPIPPLQILAGIKGKPSPSQGLELLLPSPPKNKFQSFRRPCHIKHRTCNINKFWSWF